MKYHIMRSTMKKSRALSTQVHIETSSYDIFYHSGTQLHDLTYSSNRLRADFFIGACGIKVLDYNRSLLLRRRKHLSLFNLTERYHFITTLLREECLNGIHAKSVTCREGNKVHFVVTCHNNVQPFTTPKGACYVLILSYVACSLRECKPIF